MLKQWTGAAVLLALPAVAMAAPTLKPGLWESTKIMNGEKDVERECITAEELRDAKNFRKGIPRDCELTNTRESATMLAFEYSCSKSSRGGGSFEIKASSPTQYEMSYRFKGEVLGGTKAAPLTLELQSKGRWIGSDCGDLADEDDDDSED